MLADHAEAVNGKLYVTGGCWDRLFAHVMPVRHPHMSIAVAIEVPWTATNEAHSIRVELRDDDGQQMLPQILEGEFEVGRPPGMRAGDLTTVIVVFNINNLELPRAGWYRFVLFVDGSEMGRAPFKVQPVQQPAPTSG